MRGFDYLINKLSNVTFPSINVLRWPSLFKLAIIFGIFFLALLIGPHANLSLVILSVVLVIVFFGFLLLQRQPAWGILAMIPIAFLGYFPIQTGTNVALYANFLAIPTLAVIWILRGMLIKKDVRLAESRVNLPAIIFIAVVTVSFVIGNYEWFPQAIRRASFFAQLGAYGLYVFSILLMLLVGNCLSDQRWLQRMTWLFLFFGGLYILSQAIPNLGLYILHLFLPTNYRGNPFGSMFWTFLAAMAFAQVLLNRELRLHWRLLLILLLAMEFYIGFFKGRDWVSGWLPPLVAVVTIVWLLSWRWGLTVTLIGGFGIYFFFPEVFTSVMGYTQDYSALSRTWTWPIMYEIIKASPVMGLGMANYYYYTPLFPINGYYVNFNSHNNYIDIIAQIGILGLAVFFWLIYAITRLAWQLRKRALDPFSKAYVYGCIGGLVGMLFSGMLADWFLPFLYNIGTSGFRTSIFPWMFFGGLIALDKIIKD
jgi:O-antigen ligase